ncbi:MAG: universal stress protein [Actinobacteria bacterium]|nr:MAG: universal stress protein [Actinomycetota bacterium]
MVRASDRRQRLPPGLGRRRPAATRPARALVGLHRRRDANRAVAGDRSSCGIRPRLHLGAAARGVQLPDGDRAGAVRKAVASLRGPPPTDDVLAQGAPALRARDRDHERARRVGWIRVSRAEAGARARARLRGPRLLASRGQLRTDARAPGYEGRLLRIRFGGRAARRARLAPRRDRRSARGRRGAVPRPGRSAARVPARADRRSGRGRLRAHARARLQRDAQAAAQPARPLHQAAAPLRAPGAALERALSPAVKILVGYDGSEAARRALVHAAELVGRGGTLGVINVITTQAVSSRLETVRDGERGQQRKLLQEAKMLLGEWEVQMTPVKAVGDPATEIRAAAEESGAGIVVVGRGSGLRRLIHGSVSTRLVRQAPCDVLVVH